ncbi:MAG: DUF4065 domain-containing protein [Bacteroidetes bacterium]|jgi:Uncharacterized phage-associated protein|uniref:Panacea domain-containing protein n=1 Tax=Phnomibacter sp. TaxID=2836217 RepID=UPI002FDCB4DA|nr:DUF4065 domain-containing protein [Bacteroidota bacterium]
MSIPAINIAQKIVATLSDPEKGEIVTNLKVQKLLYYVQGYHLAFFDQPLFEETIEAWMYGPVVPEVYHQYKDFGSGPITFESTDASIIQLDNATEDMFNQVMHEYGKFSAIRLMEMTHAERPWTEAFNTAHKVIDLSLMRDYFKGLVDE